MILETSCSNTLGNCCSNMGIVNVISVIKNILDLIQIIVPIILIVYAMIQLTIMVVNPDEKKNMKKLFNKFFAAAAVFFMPMVMNVVLGMMPQSFDVTACIELAKEQEEIARSGDIKYLDVYDSKRTKITMTEDKFEKGNKKEEGSKRAKEATENGGGGDGTYGGIAAGDAKGILEGAKKVHTMYEQQRWFYYTNLGQLTWNNVKRSTNNPYKATCCATLVGSALYVGGVYSEAEINKYNYNSVYGIDSLCSSHGWIKISNYNDMQAGDVAIMRSTSGGSKGHTQIYAGNGTWYNAGSTNAIQRQNPYSADARGRFQYAWRIPQK